MVNDLIFSVLPREGKVAIEKDQLKVKQVEKEAELRKLNDEEKQLNAEERESRKKQQSKDSKDPKDAKDQADPAEKQDQDGIEVDEHGRKHLDIYI